MSLRFATPSLILLVGAPASGKTSWADENFRPGQVLSSDAFRALVGTGPHDLSASDAAFALLDRLITTRLDAGLLTVVDTLGLDRKQRHRHIQLARERSVPVFAVGFDTPPAVCKQRNDDRGRTVPVGVQTKQLKRWAIVRDNELAEDGFDGIHILDTPTEVATVPAALAAAPQRAAAQAKDPKTLQFGLQLSRFPWETAEIGPKIAAVAQMAEDVGFDTLWVMDHLRQIPQIGRAWDPLPEAYTTLAFAAGVTERIELGTMVTAITYRNVGLLGKMIATLDVLSGGRAVCGLGAGWFEAEAKAYGYAWLPPAERLDVLEDALQALPKLWGPGSKPFTGKTLSLPETLCYPRPIRDTIPIVVGGGGEQRTLRLVAEYANGCNLFGSVDVVAHKLRVLGDHCEAVGRSLDTINKTVLIPAITKPDNRALRLHVEAAVGADGDIEGFMDRSGAATIADQIGRLRTYADIGVDTVVLAVGDLEHPDDLAPYRDVIAAFA